MLSILSLLSFAVIAACSYVKIEFKLSIQSDLACTIQQDLPPVTFYVLKKCSSPGYSRDYYYYFYHIEGKL